MLHPSSFPIPQIDPKSRTDPIYTAFPSQTLAKATQFPFPGNPSLLSVCCEHLSTHSQHPKPASKLVASTRPWSQSEKTSSILLHNNIVLTFSVFSHHSSLLQLSLLYLTSHSNPILDCPNLHSHHLLLFRLPFPLLLLPSFLEP